MVVIVVFLCFVTVGLFRKRGDTWAWAILKGTGLNLAGWFLLGLLAGALG